MNAYPAQNMECFTQFSLFLFFCVTPIGMSCWHRRVRRRTVQYRTVQQHRNCQVHYKPKRRPKNIVAGCQGYGNATASGLVRTAHANHT